MCAVRRDYKDSLFCHLFGAEERKGNALQLYNALAGTDYGDPDDMEITTIGDAVFLGRKNDVSFLVGDEMGLWEHQSTHNPTCRFGACIISPGFTPSSSKRIRSTYTALRCCSCPPPATSFSILAKMPDRIAR